MHLRESGGAYSHLLKPFPTWVCTAICTLSCPDHRTHPFLLVPFSGEPLFPSSVPTAWWAVCGRLGEPRLGTEHEYLPVEQRWHGWMLDPSGREGARRGISILYAEGGFLECYSITVWPTARLQMFWGNTNRRISSLWISAEFWHELVPTFRVLSRSRASGFLGIFMFIIQLTSSWHWIMLPLNCVGPKEWGDALNYTLRCKSDMAFCNEDYYTFPASFLCEFLQPRCSTHDISSWRVLCEAVPSCHVPVTPCSRGHQCLCTPVWKWRWRCSNEQLQLNI